MRSPHRITAAMWQAAPAKTMLLGLAAVFAGLTPLAYVLSASHLVALLGRSPVELASLLATCIAIAAAFGIQQILVPVTRALAHDVGAAAGLTLRERILGAALERHGLAHFDTPGAAGHLARAAEIGGRSFDATEMVLVHADKLTARTHGYGAALILGAFAWWAPLLVWAGWALLPRWIDVVTTTQMTAATASAATLRRANYLRQLAVRPAAAKEVRLFGLRDWLAERFESARRAGYGSMRTQRSRLALQLIPVLVAPAAASGFVLFHLVAAALAGELSVAALTLFVLALISAKHIGHTMAWWVRGTHHAAAVEHALTLRDRLAGCADLKPGSRPASELPRHSIRFKGVRFAYPAAGGPTLDDFDLTIPAGRSLAIVGENGAGKTTLVKLLARLHEPDAGSIRVDDTDLRELDPASWRRQLAVIFQDFVRYEASVRDNVSPADDDESETLHRALVQAGAAALVAGLPHGPRTILSRAYPGGTDLSGGQWQRVALARAFAAVQRGARVLVLDEPTANLDVRAEAELFDRFLELTRGLTTILISHRLSTVRHADMLCVVADGRVVEQGSHDELVARGGRYAGMFAVQSRRFATEVAHG